MSLVGSLIDKISELVQVKLNQLKLQASGKAATFLSRVIVVLLIVFLAFFFLLFLGLGLAFYLNTLFESAFLGFLILALVVLIFIVVMFMIGKNGKLQLAIEKAILNSFEDD